MRHRLIGLLGGTFNPVHNGHIELGLKIKKAFGLDTIRYILSANPPHKENNIIVDAKIRWKMLVAALNNIDGLEPCDIEIKRDSISYTIDTVSGMKEKSPSDKFIFIIGSDGFLNIETWKNFVNLLNMISFIVLLRKDEHKKDIIKILEKIGVKYEKNFTNEIDEKEFKVFFYSYKSDTLKNSSTIVRKRIKDGLGIEDLVHPAVAEIIKGNNLYGRTSV